MLATTVVVAQILLAVLVLAITGRRHRERKRAALADSSDPDLQLEALGDGHFQGQVLGLDCTVRPRGKLCQLRVDLPVGLLPELPVASGPWAGARLCDGLLRLPETHPLTGPVARNHGDAKALRVIEDQVQLLVPPRHTHPALHQLGSLLRALGERQTTLQARFPDMPWVSSPVELSLDGALQGRQLRLRVGSAGLHGSLAHSLDLPREAEMGVGVSGEARLGNPVLDMHLGVRGWPPALAARLADNANTEDLMALLNEHPGSRLHAKALSWSIPPEQVPDGQGLVTLLERSQALLDRLEA